MKRLARRRGAATDTKSGRKPKVAGLLEDSARKNIEAKLEILVNAIKAAQSGVAGPEVPCSRTRFNHWTPTASDGQVLQRNGNDTLKRYPFLVDAVDDATAIAKDLVRSKGDGDHRTTKEERIASARRAQRIHWTLRTIAERALVAARRELQGLREQSDTLTAAARSAEAEFQRNLAALAAENESLRAENARLVKAYAQVVPMRGRK